MSRATKEDLDRMSEASNQFLKDLYENDANIVDKLLAQLRDKDVEIQRLKDEVERLNSEVQTWKWAEAIHAKDSVNKSKEIKGLANQLNKLREEAK